MSSLAEGEWRFIRNARVARLATADGRGAPHLVPVVFAVVDGRIYVPVDGKPKRRVARLKRLENIRENENVSFLVDRYAEDWANLGFVMLSGSAAVIHAETGDAYERAAEALREKYPQYQGVALHEWMIEIRPLRAASWGAVQAGEPSST